VRHGGEGTLAPGYDDGEWTFDDDTSGVSGALKEIPNLPVITLAEDTASLRIADRESAVPEPEVVTQREDWMRWNDYGIGLLLQGDLKGAEAAFTRATEADPDNVDGWVNIGRVRVQEGNLDGARDVLERALSMAPDLARANFFYARMLREEGDFDRALGHLETVLAEYPKDRVVLNEAGRVRFLQRRYPEAVGYLEGVLAIDPEDLMAHYNLMLSYNGLGQEERALEHQQLYLRFKADESAQAITGPFRQEYPEHNRERQPIHEHGSTRRTETETAAAQ
jgi:tetratricopeptide (TPR) repeat protein